MLVVVLLHLSLMVAAMMMMLWVVGKPELFVIDYLAL